MTKRCKECEQYQRQMNDKDVEIEQLKSKVEKLEKKLLEINRAKSGLAIADSGSLQFVTIEEFNEVKAELSQYKRNALQQMKQSREAVLKRMDEEYLRKHPGASLINENFDPSLGEDEIDIPRSSKR